MTASPYQPGPLAAFAEPDPSGIEAPESPAPIPIPISRGLSVSAHRFDIETARTQAEQAVAQLRDVISNAGQESARLLDQANRASAVDVQCIELVHQLEERLSLGAQMMRAFQTQIARIEDGLEESSRREASARELLDRATELMRFCQSG